VRIPDKTATYNSCKTAIRNAAIRPPPKSYRDR
jgi:hypothetical protein